MNIFKKLFGNKATSSTSIELDETKKRSLYLDFKNIYENAMKKGRDRIFNNLRVRPGQDPFFVMGAASQQFAQSSEAINIRNTCILQVASKYNQNR